MNSLANNFKRLGIELSKGIKYWRSLNLSVLRKVFSFMGKSEKLAVIILAALAFSSIVFSGGTLYQNLTVEAPALGGQYTEGIIGQPKLLNPILALNDADESVIRLLFSGLYSYNGEGKIIPDLADDMPKISENGKEYEVKLKPSAKWHDGKNVTAEDVLFTIKTLQNPEIQSPRLAEWRNTQVEKTADDTIIFKLSDASYPFIHNLTLPILSSESWQNIEPSKFAGSELNLQPNGNGPYKLESIRKNADGSVQSMAFSSFENWHKTRAHIKNIELKFYDNLDELLNGLHGNQIDGFGFSPFEQSINLSKYTNLLEARTLRLPQYQAVFFNTSTKLFSDPQVRKALQMMTDTQKVVDEIYDGQGVKISSPILAEQIPGANYNFPAFNIDEAKKLLDEAGWVEKEPGGIRKKGAFDLKFSLHTNNFPLNMRAAELISKHWREIGVSAEVKVLPTKELTENHIKPRAYDALLFAQKLGADPDPFVFWHSSQVKNPGLNLSLYSNLQADKLMTEARALQDEAGRNEKYRQFNDVIQADSPAIFLVQNVYSYALINKINGVTLKNLWDNSLRFTDAPNWYLETKRVRK